MSYCKWLIISGLLNPHPFRQMQFMKSLEGDRDLEKKGKGSAPSKKARQPKYIAYGKANRFFINTGSMENLKKKKEKLKYKTKSHENNFDGKNSILKKHYGIRKNEKNTTHK